MKTIRIYGEEYVETKPKRPVDPMTGVCSQCAFGVSTARCAEAVRKSPEVFGGDCMARDVIYQPAPAKETA